MRPNLAPTVATTTPVPYARVTGGKLAYHSVGDDMIRRRTRFRDRGNRVLPRWRTEVPIDETVDGMAAETQPDELELDCPVCHNILCEPVTTPCGHAFCRNCLVDVLNSLFKRCPTCRGALDTATVPAVSVLLAALIQAKQPDAYAARQRELAVEAEQRREALAHGALPVGAAHVHAVACEALAPGQEALVTWTRAEDLRFLHAVYTHLPAAQRCFVQPWPWRSDAAQRASCAGVLVRVVACAPTRGLGAGAAVNVRLQGISRVSLGRCLNENADDEEADELGPLHQLISVRDALPSSPAEDQELTGLCDAVNDAMRQWASRARTWDLGPHVRVQLSALDPTQQRNEPPPGSGPEHVSWRALCLLNPLPPWPPALCVPSIKKAALSETSTAQRLRLLLTAYNASITQLDALAQTNGVVAGTIANLASGATRVRSLFTGLWPQGGGTAAAQQPSQPQESRADE